MAKLTETPFYETDIYQLETTDPVVAGPDGISNLQAKQLANRTAYLKQQTDEHDQQIAATSNSVATNSAAIAVNSEYATKESAGNVVLSDSYEGDSETKVTTEKALSSGLASVAGLEIVEYYQDIGYVSSELSPELILPDDGIKLICISKAFAPTSYSDNNIIFVSFIAESGRYILNSTSVPIAMNKESSLLMVPGGTKKIRFTKSLSADANAIHLYTYYYGV